MTKQELLSRLKEALLTEEISMPVYAKHLPSTLFWSGLSQKDIARIKAGLRMLSGDSDGHRATLEALIKKVTEAEQDVF